MKYSLGISNILEEIANLSHSILFLYFFALIIEEGFLISPCSYLSWQEYRESFKMLKCFKGDSNKSTFKNPLLPFFLDSSFRDSEKL